MRVGLQEYHVVKSITSNIVDWYGHHRRLTHIALIILIGVLAYSNTFKVPFVLDDNLCLLHNPVLGRFTLLFDLDNFQRYGIIEDLRNSLVTRCVTYATFALNFKLHGFWLPGYHAINLLLHIANACLVYFLVQRIGKRSDVDTTHVSFLSLALLTALLFVVHPVATNAVTYTVQRFALLATFFCLLALLGYQLAATTHRTGLRRCSYVAALTATILAMYSKEIAYTFPVLLTLYDFTFLDGTLRTRIRRLTPFLLTMLLLPFTVIKLSTISAVTARNAEKALELANLGHVSRSDYAITQLRVVVTYLRLMIWPTELNLDYDYPLYTSLWQSSILWSGFLLIMLVGSGIYLLLRSRTPNEPACNTARLVGFGILWFFLTLAMESSFIPLDDLIFEYRLYLPSVGFLLAVVAGAHAISRPCWRINRGSRMLFGGIVAMIVVVLAHATYSRNQVWRDPVALWEDNIRKSPNKVRPHISLASTFFMQGRNAEAVSQVLLARSLTGANWVDHYNLATLCNALDMFDEAIEEIKTVIVSEPQTAYYHGVLGQLYLNRGDIANAITAFKIALQLEPENPETQSILKELASSSDRSTD